MNIEIENGEFVIDSTLLGELLGLSSEEVRTRMRTREITSLCERGVATDAGQFRLSFFYRNQCTQLRVDADGRVIEHVIGPPRPRRRRRGLLP